MSFLLHKSKISHLEKLHYSLVEQYLEEVKSIGLSIPDLRSRKIRKVIARVKKEIDYNLAYRKGLLKKNEKITQRVLKVIIKNTMMKYMSLLMKYCERLGEGEREMINRFDEAKAFDYENGFYLTSPISRMSNILSHYELYKRIVELPGDVIELGVFKGGVFTICFIS